MQPSPASRTRAKHAPEQASRCVDTQIGARLLSTLRIPTLVTVVTLCWAVAQAVGQQPDQRYQTDYYVIYSDLDPVSVREAAIRIDRAAEEFDRRTRAFTGVIRHKLPFYLFSRAEDYHAFGGVPGSAGVFTGVKLMALAGKQMGRHTWPVLQHEGFHQFVDAVIGGDIPVWANEGLAEYFAEGIFTGDGFVTALVPPERLARIKGIIKRNRYKPFADIMTITREDWNLELAHVNYDQVWSMVHFLGHANDGAYEGSFNEFLSLVSRGLSWEHAWLQSFGPGVSDFEARWREYWTELPNDPTAALYARATVETLTSFLARAFTQKQKFNSFEAFFQAGSAQELTAHPNDWLPPSLLAQALSEAERRGQWAIEGGRGKKAKLVCVITDGTKLTGSFALRGKRVREITVTITSK